VETLRSATHSAALSPAAAKAEERLSWFWRVFGGTLLSLAGLVGVTLYQQFNASFRELRTDLNRLNETRGDWVKNEEFNNRITSLWNSLKELQVVNATVTAARERVGLLEQQVKTGDDERRELIREVQQLRERLAVVEGRRASSAGGRPVSEDK